VDEVEEVPPLGVIQLEIPLSLRGERVDKAIAYLLPEYSRSRIQTWLEAGLILGTQGPLKAKDAVLGGQAVTLTIPHDPQNTAFSAENLPLEVIYSDSDLAVISKPCSMVVHPATGNWSGTLLNALLHHYPECAEVPRAGIVHRLDKDTSGLLVIAKNIQTQFGLVKQLQNRTMERQYLALAWGKTPGHQTIDQPIGRDPRDRLKMGLNGQNGKPAITHLKTIQHLLFEGKEISLLTCVLETGRTHQIRVHLESLGHALVNDGLYKKKIPQQVGVKLQLLMAQKNIQIPGQLLHAGLLGFDHPINGKPLRFQTPPPQAFQDLFNVLGFEQDRWEKEFLL